MKPGDTYKADNGKLMIYVRCPNCDGIRSIVKRNVRMFVPVVLCTECNKQRSSDWMSSLQLNSRGP